MLKIIFLDRDGVVNLDNHYVHKKEDFLFINGVFKNLKKLNGIGYEIIIITNQSGIGRGYFNSSDFYKLNQWMLKKFKENDVNILDVFFCPHKPEDNCNCRKPKPGLFKIAAKKYDIDKYNSWMIGDKEDDITAANIFGIRNTVLVESGHNIDKSNSKSKYFLDSINQLYELVRTNNKLNQS